MDIVSRLKTFLSTNNIANSQFADTCEIPRPTISQLLNGRNKKVSDEVISKIHTSYPDLSIMWLLFGEEPMMLNGGRDANKINGSNAQLSENLKNRISVDDGAKEPNFSDSDDDKTIMFFGEEAPRDIADISTSDAAQMPFSEAVESFARSVGKHNVDKNLEATGSKKRHIVNVVVFYSDNSFESFVPDNR